MAVVDASVVISAICPAKLITAQANNGLTTW